MKIGDIAKRSCRRRTSASWCGGRWSRSGAERGHRRRNRHDARKLLARGGLSQQAGEGPMGEAEDLLLLIAVHAARVGG